MTQKILILKNWQWKNAFYILSLSVNEKLEEILGTVMDAFPNIIIILFKLKTSLNASRILNLFREIFTEKTTRGRSLNPAVPQFPYFGK